MCQRQYLSALFAFGEETRPNTQVTQRHNNQPRSVLTRTARYTTHALAAIPNHIRFQQRLYLLVVTRLHGCYDLARIITIELRRRADSRAGTAVDAGVEPLSKAVVLH